jgi:hypothetical protein
MVKGQVAEDLLAGSVALGALLSMVTPIRISAKETAPAIAASRPVMVPRALTADLVSTIDMTSTSLPTHWLRLATHGDLDHAGSSDYSLRSAEWRPR